MGKSETDEKSDFFYVILFLSFWDLVGKVNFLKILDLLKFRKIMVSPKVLDFSLTRFRPMLQFTQKPVV